MLNKNIIQKILGFTYHSLPGIQHTHGITEENKTKQLIICAVFLERGRWSNALTHACLEIIVHHSQCITNGPSRPSIESSP